MDKQIVIVQNEENSVKSKAFFESFNQEFDYLKDIDLAFTPEFDYERYEEDLGVIIRGWSTHAEVCDT